MRFPLIALLLASCVAAEDRWILIASGPFEVYSAAGEKPARERMNELEQFREVFGNAIGKKDLKLVRTLRLLIYKKQPPGASGQIALGRDANMAALAENSTLPPGMQKQLARLLLDDNTNRMPESIESGLIALFSTLHIAGTHITLGEPVPPAERTRDWARMQMLTTDPAYSGRARIMLSNLEQSPDMDAADHNAFEKSPAQIEKQLDDYMKAGNYSTTEVSARALNPMKDFRVKEVETDAAKLAQADYLFSQGQVQQASAAYTALHGPEAAEGLGLIALKDGKKTEAKQLFASSAESGSKSARLWLNLALLETDAAKSRTDLHKATDLNPNWGDPWRQLANFDPNPMQKIADLKKAAALDRRNIEIWKELASVTTKANQFADAAKAWSGAERAAVNDRERESIEAARLAIEGERSDFEAAERKRAAEEQAREVDRVRQASLAEIHVAEDAARKQMNPNGEPIPTATVWMDELNGKAKVEGVLQRFDCLGRLRRLVIVTDDGRTTQLAVRDTGKLGVTQGEKMMGCGAQNPARRVVVQYIAQPDKKLGTVGDATILEFR
ncbi:MAG: hypothetical protein ABSH09_07780 [Bryobacteraceae bacterium]